MLAPPTISSTPLHGARLHARPPSGAEPQQLPEAERKARDASRARADRIETSRPGPASVDPAEVARAEAGAPPRPDRGSDAELTLAERRIIADLARRDRVVRAHEAAHAIVGGRHAGPARYRFEPGPDGRLYAVEGSVQIDLSTDPSNPEATIAKMEVVKAAALAPADPSPADRRVAALADRLRRAAEADLARLEAIERAERSGGGEGSTREADRLTRLALLFAQTMLLPTPEPTVSRAA